MARVDLNVWLIVAPANCGALVICTNGSVNDSRRFSVVEDGLIGGLGLKGLDDDVIGQLLDRHPSSVSSRRRRIWPRKQTRRR